MKFNYYVQYETLILRTIPAQYWRIWHLAVSANNYVTCPQYAVRRFSKIIALGFRWDNCGTSRAPATNDNIHDYLYFCMNVRGSNLLEEPPCSGKCHVRFHRSNYAIDPAKSTPEGCQKSPEKCSTDNLNRKININSLQSPTHDIDLLTVNLFEPK